jgi:hypothetical protein
MPESPSKDMGVASRGCYTPPPALYLEVIHEVSTETLFFPVSLNEPQEVKLKPGFSTACWAYLPPHRIYLGTGMFDKSCLKAGLTIADQKKYIANHYHHELAHGIFTERNLSRINELLASISAPFSLYNLFEDAYIEDKYRVANGYQFGWLEIEVLEVAAVAHEILFGLIQAEGDVSIVRHALMASVPAEMPESSKADQQAEILALLHRVHEYYLQIVGVSSSFELLPILSMWIDEFGQPPQEANKPPKGMQDMELSFALSSSPAAEGEFSADCLPASGSRPPPPVKGIGAHVDVRVSGNGKVLSDISTKVDVPRARKLAEQFVKFFEVKHRNQMTETPGKRLSARHLALGRPCFKEKVLLGRKRQTVLFVADCSGSMEGSHVMEGKVIISALSELARRNMVSGHVVLSLVLNRKARWETFSLPMPQHLIDRIQAYGQAEGLEQAIVHNMPLAKKADHVFVYTDGHICDKHIDKAALHRQSVFTWGLYAGDDSKVLSKLLTYFDKAIIRESAEALVDAILVQNR